MSKTFNAKCVMLTSWVSTLFCPILKRSINSSLVILGNLPNTNAMFVQIYLSPRSRFRLTKRINTMQVISGSCRRKSGNVPIATKNSGPLGPLMSMSNVSMKAELISNVNCVQGSLVPNSSWLRTSKSSIPEWLVIFADNYSTISITWINTRGQLMALFQQTLSDAVNVPNGTRVNRDLSITWRRNIEEDEAIQQYNQTSYNLYSPMSVWWAVHLFYKKKAWFERPV